MKISGTGYENKKPGDDIDSWCGKCKFVLAHTIEAMVDKKPARVVCNTCKSQHGYKAQPPQGGSRPASKSSGTAAAGSKGLKTPGSRYRALAKAQEAMPSAAYSPKNRYEAGHVVDHPMFGRGFVITVREGFKIEVQFEDGLKTLIHAR